MCVLISVIIPVYNTEKYLAECLNSIIQQSLQEIEIICVNDASTDSSLRILQEYASKDGRISIISYDKNKGQAYARNLGLEKATGEYVYFVDADDMVKMEALSTLYYIATKDILDLVCFEADVIYENEDVKKRYPYVLEPMTPCNGIISGRDFFIKAITCNHWPRAVWRQFWSRRFLIENNIRFRVDASPHEDNLFTFQAVQLVRRMRYTPDKYYLYRRRDGSIMTGGVTMKRFLAQAVSCVEIFRFCQQHLNRDDMDFFVALRKCFDSEILSWRVYWRGLLRTGQNPSKIHLSDPLADLLCHMIFTGKYRHIQHNFSTDIYSRLQGKTIIIYGAGGVGRETEYWLQDMGLSWTYLAVSDAAQVEQNPEECVSVLSDLAYLNQDAIVLIAARPPYNNDMLCEARRLGFDDWILMVV